jgi:hypothetical protein
VAFPPHREAPIASVLRVQATVAAVERRSRAKRAWKDANGDPQVEREDLGWFIVLKEFGIAIGIGADEPELSAGQRVKLTIEAA